MSAETTGLLRAAVILVAAGDGRRVGGTTNKVLLPLAGAPVFVWSLRSVEMLDYPAQVVVVVRDQDRGVVERDLARHFPKRDFAVVTGGATRHASEWNGLCAIANGVDAGEIDVVAIHDAARPLAGPSMFNTVVGLAASRGGTLPMREQPTLVLREATSAPSVQGRLVGVQTPQAFQARPLLAAYRQAARDGYVGTDTAACVQRYTDLSISALPGPARNMKITHPEDLALAERLLSHAAARPSW